MKQRRTPPESERSDEQFDVTKARSTERTRGWVFAQETVVDGNHLSSARSLEENLGNDRAPERDCATPGKVTAISTPPGDQPAAYTAPPRSISRN